MLFGFKSLPVRVITALLLLLGGDLNASPATDASVALCLENLRVVPLDTPEGEKFEAFAAGVFKKIFPEHDLKKQPVRFYLSDSSEINAATVMGANPRVLVFTAGLMKFLLKHLPNIDAFAAVLGHEWAHNLIEFELGEGKNSKTEEFIADLAPLEPIHLAGFDIRQSLEFELLLRKEVPRAPLLVELLDVHGMKPNREKAFKDALAFLDRKYGGLRQSPTPLPSFMATIVQTAKHVSFLDRKTRESSELEAIEATLASLNPDQQARAKDVESRLNAIQIDPANTGHIDALDRIAELIFSIIVKNSSGQDLLLSEAFGAKIYTRLSVIYKKAMGIRTIGRWPMGRLRKINDSIERFIRAENAQTAATAAHELLERIRHEVLPRSFLQTLVWTNFSIPNKKELRENKKDFIVEWNRFLSWVPEDKSGDIAKALNALGVDDDRLNQLLPLRASIEIWKPSFKKISAGPSNGNETAQDLRLDPDGRIRDFEKLRHAQDAKNERQSQTRRSILRLLDAGMQGDTAAEKELRQEVLNFGQGDLKIGEKIYGLNEAQNNFRLFIDFNDWNHWGLPKGVATNARRTGLIIESLTSKLIDLLKLDLKTFRDPVRDGFLSKDPKILAPFGALLHVEADLFTSWNSFLGLRLFGFVLKDPFRIFSQQERLALIEGARLLASGPDRLDTTDIRLRTDILPIVRSSLGYSKPETAEALIALSQKTGMSDSLVFTAEFFEFIKRGDQRSLKIEPLLPHVNKAALDADDDFHETLQALVKRLEWPKDVESKIKLFKGIESLDLFKNNPKLQFKILRKILGSLAAKKDLSKRIDLLEKILHGKRINDPKLRERAFSLWIAAVMQKHGTDDGRPEYRAALQALIQRNNDDLLLIDRIELFSRLSARLEAQKELSHDFKRALFKTSRKGLEASHAQMVFGEALLEAIRRRPQLRHPTVEFLTSPFTPASRSSYANIMTGDPAASEDLWIATYGDFEGENSFQKQPLAAETMNDMLSLIHENFWTAPFPIRAVILDEILFPDNGTSVYSFRSSFEFALNRMLPLDQKYSAEARKIITTYLELVPSYQKSLLLAAMLVSSVKDETLSNGVGERLAGMLELMGPAETKLGQAMHSHPQTPEDLRQGVRRLKSSVDVPMRWDLFDLLKSRLPAEARERVSRVGKIMGAASYYVVAEIEYRTNPSEPETTSAVIALLRPNILARAENGFALLKRLADDLEDSGEISSAFTEMVEQARQMSVLETDSSVAAKQYEIAARRYNNRQVRVGDRVIRFKTAEILEWGNGYRIMKKAPGEHFNDLPEDTSEALARKTDLARAYVALELHLLLEGLEFDHDRHGAQLRVDQDEVTLFDFGGMSLTPPTTEERAALGEALGELLRHVQEEKPSESLFSGLHDKLQQASRDAEKARQYLASIKRALLALNDFFRYIPAKELPLILRKIVEKGGVHPEIALAFVKKAESLGSPPFGASASFDSVCERYLVEIK